MNRRQFKYFIANLFKFALFFIAFLIVLTGLILSFNYFSKTYSPLRNIVIKHPYLYIPGIVLVIMIPFTVKFLIAQRSRFKSLLKKMDQLDYPIEEKQKGIFNVKVNPACHLEISEGHPIILRIHNLKLNDIKLTKKVNYSVKYRLLGIEENSNWYDIFHKTYHITPKQYSQNEFDTVILIFKYLGNMFESFQSIDHQVEITMDNFLVHANPVEISSYFQKIEQMIQHLDDIDLLSIHSASSS
ncbi:hypothetical protein MUP95_07095 [bacterium]|nr:hypothetical protein [bacterium]